MYLKLGFLLVLFSIVFAKTYFEREDGKLRDPEEELRDNFIKTELEDTGRYRYRYRARRLGCFKGKRKICSRYYTDNNTLRWSCRCV
ncbi:uncharacterized protein [Pocillopora verrucosa]|uniref:uncharacterized protein n=1 Tax=Pocillopora verrucosa TaxID=203993 RepID=UPI00333E232C